MSDGHAQRDEGEAAEDPEDPIQAMHHPVEELGDDNIEYTKVGNGPPRFLCYGSLSIQTARPSPWRLFGFGGLRTMTLFRGAKTQSELQ